jgi:hypothetical protein
MSGPCFKPEQLEAMKGAFKDKPTTLAKATKNPSEVKTSELQALLSKFAELESSDPPKPVLQDNNRDDDYDKISQEECDDYDDDGSLTQEESNRKIAVSSCGSASSGRQGLI